MSIHGNDIQLDAPFAIFFSISMASSTSPYSFTGYFNAGESDKGMKKSPALMLEALQADADDHEKHHVPFVSKITPYISQLILAAKRGVEPSGDGSRGAKKAVVPEKYLAELEGIMDAYSSPSSSSKPDSRCPRQGVIARMSS